VKSEFAKVITTIGCGENVDHRSDTREVQGSDFRRKEVRYYREMQREKSQSTR
jgi:hypothetical protein